MKNKMSEGTFYILYIALALLASEVYAFRFMEFEGTWNTTFTKYLFGGLLGGCNLLLMGYVLEKGRNVYNMLVGVLFPLCIYRIVLMASYRSKLLSIALRMVCLVFFRIYALLYGGKIKPSIHERNQYKFRTILPVCASILSIALFYTLHYIPWIDKESVLASNIEREASVYSTKEGFDDLSKLKDYVWENLSLQQRLDVMQSVVNYETEYLGLPYQITTAAAKLSENECANYDDNRKLITFSEEHLMEREPIEMVDTACHEMYHSYAHRLMEAYDTLPEEYQDLLIVRNGYTYKYESANYVSGREDDKYDEYYSQQFEEDARLYGEFRSYEYLQYME